MLAHFRTEYKAHIRMNNSFPEDKQPFAYIYTLVEITDKANTIVFVYFLRTHLRKYRRVREMLSS